MPVGTFQPSADAAWNERNDLDLWRSIACEYNEEFLGAPEHYGSDHASIDYDSWPFFRTLTESVERFVSRELMQAAGAALLWLAWRHKAALLEC